MTELDDAIDAALKSLAADPPEHMQQRIVARLRAESAPQVPWWPESLRRYMPVIGGAAVAALAIAFFTHRVVRVNVPVVDRQVAGRAVETGEKTKSSAGSVARAVLMRAPTASSMARRSVVRESSGDAHLNIPAPPLPLTEQERLLLRLVRQNSGVQMAALTEPAMEAAVRREQREVHDFFALQDRPLPESEQSTDDTAQPNRSNSQQTGEAQ